MEVLSRFSLPTQTWFRENFAAPTAAQQEAWQAISAGENALVVAPTGSGKTLAAFLWAIDQLATSDQSAAPDPLPIFDQLTAPDQSATAEATTGVRVLYISPLKALAVDVERNLQAPLRGIQATARELGLRPPSIQVGVRTGDTPAAERRRLVRLPPDILITTPESLFLLLTSAARAALTKIETVIVDEVHAVAGSKRGAHLALSLERLDALLPHPAQRIGLSATVRPAERVANFLGGVQPVRIVAPKTQKNWQLEVVVPLPDMDQPGKMDQPGDPETQSVWPAVEERIVELIEQHRSTLIFTNSRRLAERLTARISELWTARLAECGEEAGSGYFARAHHGSVSHEERKQIEEDLKAGRLRAVVATSSLELGIDMGAIDLVIQVEAPPSVASGLQRIGRAGHRVGAVSHGIIFPKFRGDLLQAAVVTQRMRSGAIEAIKLPINPLDVLAQQLVAMVAMDDWRVDDLERLVRRSANFVQLPRTALESLLDMLTGRYPSDEFAELRPRLNWDRSQNLLTGRRGAQHLAVTSGGTIPDRGLYSVFLATEAVTVPSSPTDSSYPTVQSSPTDSDFTANTGRANANRSRGGRRVGELDEEMVYESRVGDVFALGTSTWRIEKITHDQVIVTPAPGVPARMPFWHGDALGRPAELGEAVGAFVRRLDALPPASAKAELIAAGLDEWAADNLLDYLKMEKQQTGYLPTDRQLVVQHSRDEVGDWRVVVLSPYGGQVHAPWALLAAARLRERFGADVQAMHGDDGMVFRIPDNSLDWEAGEWSELDDIALLADIFPTPDELTQAVTAQLGDSALFASRFREAANRALLLPKRRPNQRRALWQQRLQAAQLLEVANSYPSFPIIMETARECLNDVFDVPALEQLLARVRSGAIQTVSVTLPQPSPFTSSLLLGYMAAFLYEYDSPLAERRAAALSLDPQLLAQLLGQVAVPALAELLEPDQLARTEAELQHLTDSRKARDADELTDLLRALGPLTTSQLAARCQSPPDVPDWLAELVRQQRVGCAGLAQPPVELAGARDSIAGPEVYSAQSRAGLAEAGRQSPDDRLWIAAEDLAELPSVARWVLRYARSHAPFTLAELGSWLERIDRSGFVMGSPARVAQLLADLVAAGKLAEGELRPAGWVAPEPPLVTDNTSVQYCDPNVLQTLRRRSIAALRKAVEPVSATQFARFLPSWHEFGARRGSAGVLRTIEQLAGVSLAASAWETLILPARVSDNHPAMLDELLAAGEVCWQGNGALASGDGWVSFHLRDSASLTLHPSEPTSVTSIGTDVLTLLGQGALFAADLAAKLEWSQAKVLAELWELAWSGLVSNDSFAGVRTLLKQGSQTHRTPRAPLRTRYGRPRLRLGHTATPPPQAGGRWWAIPAPDTDPTRRAVASAESLLDRYPVLTKGSVLAEGVTGGFATIYRVLAAAEEAGQLRRGYFIEGLGAAQFAPAAVIDRLREDALTADSATSTPIADSATSSLTAITLAACDPANPYGAALPWPIRQHGHSPGRKPGALVSLVAGQLTLYVERGGRTALTWSTDPATLATAAASLSAQTLRQAAGDLTIEKVNGTPILSANHPLAAALTQAGFKITPRGYTLRMR
ncbi:MAG: DEAD/DEAH box helicase [Propionibacteriaceae bacterium]|jgi:ATP-dependent Lhr-like helicase|nr:DEAD/DEAH box helicase [Propionibacteriaceae bacterium]